MKNKILFAGILMFVGGFLLADAANLELMAQIRGVENKKDLRDSATAFPGTSAEVCKVEFKKAEEAYKLAVRAAKDKRDLAIRAKNRCLQQVKDARTSVSPSPTVTVTP